MATPCTLKLLGGASIAGPDGPLSGRAVQRHRLALLALLAATPQGMSRDKIVALLWPERQADRARHALSDSIYRINHALGREAVVAVGDRDLRLDAAALPNDLAGFRRALEEQRWERAVEVYGGTFLDGFHLPGPGEFERWVDQERRHLSRRYAEALERLAEEREACGDRPGAVEAWRRRAGLDRYDSRVAVRLMESWVRAGNPAAALRHARLHAQLLEREFETPPDSEVLALADRIREGRDPPSRGSLRAPDRGPTDDVAEPGPAGATPESRPDPSTPRDGVGHRDGDWTSTQASEEAPVVSRVPSGPPHPAQGRPWTRTVAVAGVTLAAILAAIWSSDVGSSSGDGQLSGRPPPDAARMGRQPAAEVPAPRSIAVLAFEDMSAEGDRAWFADGIAEEIINRLTRIDGLRVVSRQSSFAFRDRPVDVRYIADALGAGYVMDGSVRGRGDSAWVSVQLIDGATGFQSWSETYATTSSSERLRSIQNRIAGRVATTLSLRIRGRSQAPSDFPDDPAYQAYFEGRYDLRRFQSGASRDPGMILRSIGYLRQVVDDERRWAPGWAALGEAHHWAAFIGLDPAMHRAESKRALRNALALDPNHAQANASLGYVIHRADHDYEAANARFQRALALDTEQYWHCGYSLFLLWAERYEDAVDATRRAEGHDPMFWPLKVLLSSAYRCAGRAEDAARKAELALSERPDAISARRELALALDRSGRAEDALKSLDEGDGLHPYLQLVRALVLARDGRTSQAESLLLRVDAEQAAYWAKTNWQSKLVTVPAVQAATLVALGRRGGAVDLLEAAMEEDPDILLYDRCYPELRSLEQDPRYRALLARTGVPG